MCECMWVLSYIHTYMYMMVKDRDIGYSEVILTMCTRHTHVTFIEGRGTYYCNHDLSAI